MNSSQFSAEYNGFVNHPATQQRDYETPMNTLERQSMGMHNIDMSRMETKLHRKNVNTSAITKNTLAQYSADGDIRHHMCSMLTELRSHTRVLVHLMRQHDFIAMLSEQQFESYQNAIERLGATSVQMEEVIAASNHLDQRRELCS